MNSIDKTGDRLLQEAVARSPQPTIEKGQGTKLAEAAFELAEHLIKEKPQLDSRNRPTYLFAGSLAVNLLYQADTIKYPNGMVIKINERQKKGLEKGLRSIKDVDIVIPKEVHYYKGPHDYFSDRFSELPVSIRTLLVDIGQLGNERLKVDNLSIATPTLDLQTMCSEDTYIEVDIQGKKLILVSPQMMLAWKLNSCLEIISALDSSRFIANLRADSETESWIADKEKQITFHCNRLTKSVKDLEILFHFCAEQMHDTQLRERILKEIIAYKICISPSYYSSDKGNDDFNLLPNEIRVFKRIAARAQNQGFEDLLGLDDLVNFQQLPPQIKGLCERLLGDFHSMCNQISKSGDSLAWLPRIAQELCDLPYFKEMIYRR